MLPLLLLLLSFLSLILPVMVVGAGGFNKKVLHSRKLCPQPLCWFFFCVCVCVFPLYLLLLLACSFRLVCVSVLSAFPLLFFSASLFCSSAFPLLFLQSASVCFWPSACSCFCFCFSVFLLLCSSASPLLRFALMEWPNEVASLTYVMNRNGQLGGHV